jgi:hypothetical protein
LTPSLSSLDSLFLSIVLATLAIGLPILLLLSIRFLWDRNLKLSRSKELEKLIWQVHRIASALEHQLNLSFPAVQPGTEEPRDLAYLQQLPAHPAAATPSVATPRAMAATAAAASTPATPEPAVQQTSVQQPAAQQAPAQQSTTPPPAAQQPSPPAQERREPSAQPPRAGVNSMFGM